MISFTIDWVLVLTFVTAILLPLLVGLVTKLATKPGVRAVLLALLSAVAGLLAELLNALTSGTPYDLGTALFTWVGVFVVAVATHFGVWKPTGVSEKAKAVGGSNTTVIEESNPQAG